MNHLTPDLKYCKQFKKLGLFKDCKFKFMYHDLDDKYVVADNFLNYENKTDYPAPTVGEMVRELKNEIEGLEHNEENWVVVGNFIGMIEDKKLENALAKAIIATLDK